MSKVEITATNAAGEVFVGYGEVTWLSVTVENAGKAFKPRKIENWRIYESDGSLIGWMPLPLKQGDDDDDEAEAEAEE